MKYAAQLNELDHKNLTFAFFRIPAGDPQHQTTAARLRAMGVCSGLVATALAIGLTIESVLHVQNLLLVFLPVVLFAAVRYGFWLASWASLLSVLGTSFFLAAPIYSFVVSDPENVWALALFLITAAFTSSLASLARQRAAAAEYHSRTVELLYGFSSRLAGIASSEDLAREIAQQMSSFLDAADVRLVLRDQAVYEAYSAVGPPSAVDADEAHAIRAVWSEQRSAGPGTDRFAHTGRRYWPLATTHGTVGVLTAPALTDEPDPRESSPRLFDALLEQAAVNLERTQLAERMRKSEILAETDKLRTALLTSISHDLRTPLASILGNVTSLRQLGHLYDEQTRNEMLELTEKETLRLSRFVDNLLHMTRIDAGSLRPTLELIDLSDVIGASLARVSKTLSHHEIKVDLANEIPMIRADFMLMEHTLVNLLENAAKFSPSGSTILVRAQTEDSAVLLSVSDEGPGIPPAELDLIFERFYRVTATDHRPAGTGLGLAICKGFVEALGGSINAANRTDRRGAVFTIALPIQRLDGADR